ncbi:MULTISPECIES: YjdF family protein [unclassified Adlercreutzia]|uniref:YjdF family protein n=1 Tax=unclassified Adlercreutzia TaxID=2636013 RepID=UPI0013EB7F69|nr:MULTISPECIES: YjdF family protein [unclassified Adlercreutzia]
MQISVSSTLTVFHDGQFWVGVVEHVEGGELSVARIVFGAEPSNEEVLQFVVRKWESLSLHGSAEVEAPKEAKNPKRRMREASRELSRRPVSTKSQQALSEAREAQKADEKARRARARREAQEAQFSQKQEKKKQKRKGH